MKFLDELPGRGSTKIIDSEAIIAELEERPHEWGEFYVQGDEQESTARNRAAILRTYAKRQNIKVEIATRTLDDGKIHAFARLVE